MISILFFFLRDNSLQLYMRYSKLLCKIVHIKSLTCASWFVRFVIITSNACVGHSLFSLSKSRGKYSATLIRAREHGGTDRGMGKSYHIKVVSVAVRRLISRPRKRIKSRFPLPVAV